jgi:hypothetical protein
MRKGGREDKEKEREREGGGKRDLPLLGHLGGIGRVDVLSGRGRQEVDNLGIRFSFFGEEKRKTRKKNPKFGISLKMETPNLEFC